MFMALGLGFMYALWLYYDVRDARMNTHHRAQAIFYCVKCCVIYTASDTADIAECPDCGLKNTRLKF